MPIDPKPTQPTEAQRRRAATVRYGVVSVDWDSGTRWWVAHGSPGPTLGLLTRDAQLIATIEHEARASALEEAAKECADFRADGQTHAVALILERRIRALLEKPRAK